jgi:hypothetical protein
LIQNNYVTDIVNSNNRNTGIETWSSVGTIVEYNTIIMSNAGAGGFYAKNRGNSQITLRYNYVDLSAGSSEPCGLAWDLSGNSSATTTCHHNIVLALDHSLANLGTGLDPSTVAERQVVYNNTLVGTSWATVGMDLYGTAACMQMYNMIITRSGTVGGRGDVDVNVSMLSLIDYNLYHSPPSLGLTTDGSTGYPSNLYSTLSAWGAALPAGCTGKDAHSGLGAPTFVGGSPAFPAQKYKLSNGSLGQGTGSTDGTTGGAACDMGAWGGASPPSRIGTDF